MKNFKFNYVFMFALVLTFSTITIFTNSCKKEEPLKMGEVVFYPSFNTGSIITVNVQGTTGIITNYNSSIEPDCNSVGYFTIKLKHGIYNFTASNRDYSWSGKIAVSGGDCKSMALNR